MRLRITQIFINIFIVISLTGCKSLYEIEIEKGNELAEGDRVVMVQMKSGETINFFNENGRYIAPDSVIVGYTGISDLDLSTMLSDSTNLNNLPKGLLKKSIINKQDIKRVKVDRYNSVGTTFLIVWGIILISPLVIYLILMLSFGDLDM